MMKLRWAILFTALTVFLTACPPVDPPNTATLELTAAPNPVPAGGAPVTLTATVTAGAENVASVDFAVEDAGTALGSDSDTTDNIYSFTTTTPVTTDTTFVATARDADGTPIGSAEVAVTVTVPGPTTVTLSLTATPNPVPAGGAPVELTAAITAGQDQVTSVDFSAGGTFLGTDNTAPYTFTTAPVTAATTFVANAKNASGITLATSSVAVTVTPGTTIPAGATKAATLAEINAVTATSGDAAIIAVTADITCTDPSLCVDLEEGQTLVGADAAGTVKAVRRFTTNGSGARAIEMNNNTTVEGFEFDGTGLFIAIDAPATVTGSVTITNVTVGEVITAGGSNPIKISSTGAVAIDGLTIPNSIRTTTISGFSNLTILNSSISYTLPATGVSSAFLAASRNATVSIDGLTITSNRSDPTTFNPFFINQIEGSGTLNVTVKNSRVVVPATGAATARSFVFGVDAASTGGAMVLDTTPGLTVSTGNTTNAGAGVTRSANVTGTIALAVVP
jgi:hypothetical protein